MVNGDLPDFCCSFKFGNKKKHFICTLKPYTVFAGCCLYFLTGNSSQNVYNGKFSITNDDFSVTNVRN